MKQPVSKLHVNLHRGVCALGNTEAAFHMILNRDIIFTIPEHNISNKTKIPFTRNRENENHDCGILNETNCS